MKFGLRIPSFSKRIAVRTSLKRVIRHNLGFIISLVLTGNSISSCDFKKSDSARGSYVKPSVNYKGQILKGHVRKKVSIDKNAIKNRNRSLLIL